MRGSLSYPTRLAMNATPPAGSIVPSAFGLPSTHAPLLVDDRDVDLRAYEQQEAKCAECLLAAGLDGLLKLPGGLDAWRAEVRPRKIVYVGDGSGDYCPALRLGPGDVLCARAGSLFSPSDLKYCCGQAAISDRTNLATVASGTKPI